MTKLELRRIAANIDPTSYLDVRDYLAAVYQALKEHAGQYSYVRFTADMGFGNCNALYLVIHGHRPLTVKGARKICEALALKGVARRYFLKLTEAQQGTSGEERVDAFDELVELKSRTLPTELDRKQLEFYNHWYNAAILELLGLDEASDDPEWLSARLMPTVSPLKVKESLKLLKKLELVTMHKSQNRLVPSQTTMTTGSEVYGLAVVRYHQQMIALAQDSLADVSPEERDVSAVTIKLAAKDVARFKEEIQAFRSRLLDMSNESKDADEVVQVNIQMFPIGKRSPRSKRNED